MGRTLTVDGVTRTVAEWAEEVGVDPRLIHSRLRNGWSEVDAVAPARQPRTITANGVTRTVAEWAEEVGASRQAIYARLRNAWSEVDAVTVPIGACGPRADAGKPIGKARVATRYEVEGRRLSISEWAEELGTTYAAIYSEARAMESRPRPETIEAVLARRVREARRGRLADAVEGAAERWERGTWRQKGARPSQHVVARCLAAIALLAEHPHGLRIDQFAERLGVSRATAYRDLDALRKAGVRLEQVPEEGSSHVRWVLGERRAGE